MNNLFKNCHIFRPFLLLFCGFLVLNSTKTKAQDSSIYVQNSIKEYKHSVLQNANSKMVDLKKMIPNLEFDFQYSTPKNFVGKKLYSKIKTTYLRIEVANALKKAQLDLNEIGLGLKIWDAYRPYSVTKKMWQIVPDEKYAANPKYGSGHNRGIAVDLTLIDLKTKVEMPMGTSFDNFTDTAHSDYQNLPDSVKSNRQILKSIMGKNGFVQLKTEWWHFYWPNSKQFPLMNFSFSQLARNVHRD